MARKFTSLRMSDKPSIATPPTSTPRRSNTDKLNESLKESAIVTPHKEPDYCVDNQMIESRQK